jgi:histidine ammonia-lyase
MKGPIWDKNLKLREMGENCVLKPYETAIILMQKTYSFAGLLLNLWRGLQSLRIANLTVCLSFEANNGVTNAFTPLVNEAKEHVGQIQIAKELFEIVTKEVCNST